MYKTNYGAQTGSLSSRLLAFFVIGAICAFLGACTATGSLPQTPDQWKEALQTVPVMFVAMLLGTLAYGLIQQRTATNNGKPMGFLEYWSYAREVVITLIVNIAAFAGALMADQLTLLGAFTLGLTGTALADIPSGGRTAALDKTPEARG